MNGAELIAQERQRQIEAEGFDSDHDDVHGYSELLSAAVCYIDDAHGDMSAQLAVDIQGSLWPWDESWFKPSRDPVRTLVKAGALIAAEIDRLQRSTVETLTLSRSLRK